MAFKLAGLADVLRKAGVKVVEADGWKTRGYLSQDLQGVAGTLWHHTATNRQRFTTDNAPTLGMCINGREDLAGPLCNIVLGRDGTAYLVAAGVANHAGTGSAPGIPINAGNHWLVGIEMESSGIAPWDWTPAQLAAAPRIGAAIERAYNAGIAMGHLEYSDAGKIDPAGWPGGMDALRNAINTIIAGGTTATPQSITITPITGGLTMADIDKIMKELSNIKKVLIDSYIIDGQTERRAGIQPIVVQNQARINLARAELAGLRGVVDQLAAKQGVAIDYGKVEAAVKKALAEGVVSVDVTIAGGK